MTSLNDLRLLVESLQAALSSTRPPIPENFGHKEQRQVDATALEVINNPAATAFERHQAGNTAMHFEFWRLAFEGKTTP